jgi:hypothetical protein
VLNEERLVKSKACGEAGKVSSLISNMEGGGGGGGRRLTRRLSSSKAVYRNTKQIQEEEIKEALIERGEAVESGATKEEMSVLLSKYRADFMSCRKLLSMSKKQTTQFQTMNVTKMRMALSSAGVVVLESTAEEDNESDDRREEMIHRRLLKRCAQVHRLRMFRRSMSEESKKLQSESVEIATVKLHERGGEKTPLVEVETVPEVETLVEKKNRDDRSTLKWLDAFSAKFMDNQKKRVRKPGFRSESGSVLRLNKGGEVEIGNMDMEGDLEVEEGADVKVKGVLDLTTMDNEIEEDEIKQAERTNRTKGVSQIKGSLNLDGEKAKVVVDEALINGKMFLGNGEFLLRTIIIIIFDDTND